MSPQPGPAPSGFSRRALLAGAAGLAVLVAGCTGDAAGEEAAVPREQADAFAAQVAVQESVVAAYAAAVTADPALAGVVGQLPGHAEEQRDLLRTAAPDAPSSAAPSTALPPAGTDVRGWLRAQVGAAAAAHESACADQVGARAALLGSIAAGLRGQEAALA